MLFTYTIIYCFLQFSEAKTQDVDYNLKALFFISPSVYQVNVSFLLLACSCKYNTSYFATNAKTLDFSLSIVQCTGGNKDGSLDGTYVEITTQVSLQPQYILDKIII